MDESKAPVAKVWDYNLSLSSEIPDNNKDSEKPPTTPKNNTEKQIITKEGTVVSLPTELVNTPTKSERKKFAGNSNIKPVPETKVPTNYTEPPSKEEPDEYLPRQSLNRSYSRIITDNTTKHGLSLSENSLLHLRGTNNKLVIGMVGLPARGKSYISRKLSRYLNWLGYRCRTFNLGEYRRSFFGTSQSADFYDRSNEGGVAVREKVAKQALEDLWSYLKGGGHSAIFDGTNSTRARRTHLHEYFARRRDEGWNVELVWVESICNDRSVVENSINTKVKKSPDYVNWTRADAVKDFMERVKAYEKSYETVGDESEENSSYVKLIDLKKVHTNNIFGYLPTRIVFFLMNLRINTGPIYISRHGQSEDNLKGLIGGDSPLTKLGQEYALQLNGWLQKQEEIKKYPDGIPVWCSTKKRALQTAAAIECCSDFVQWRYLEELDGGICDGLTYTQIEEKYPEVAKGRKENKLSFRYPGGESYIDVIHRLEPVIFELERVKCPVLVIAHQAVLRCLLAYFYDLLSTRLPYIEIPLHTVVKIKFNEYACITKKFKFNIDEQDLK